MFKLLAKFDFQHFNETGRTVTNLKYFAFKNGPVPKEFYEEIKTHDVPIDFKDYFAIIPFRHEGSEKSGGIFRCKDIGKLNLKVFSQRQERILKEIAEIYKEADASLASHISHLEGTPWHKTVKSEGCHNQEINYLKALEDNSKITIEQAQQSLQDESEFLKNYSLLPYIPTFEI